MSEIEVGQVWRTAGDGSLWRVDEVREDNDTAFLVNAALVSPEPICFWIRGAELREDKGWWRIRRRDVSEKIARRA